MPRRKRKRYGSRWANQAASLAKTLTKHKYDHHNNTTTQPTVETDVSHLPAVDERTETQETQDNGRKSVSNPTTTDVKNSKKKTRPGQRTKDVVSDDSSGNEWKPRLRPRKRHKKKHSSGRAESTPSSTASSSPPSDRDDQDTSTVEEPKPSAHQITFSLYTPSTDKDSDEGNTSNQNATRVKLDCTTSDDAKKIEFGITSSTRPYAAWSEFCAKLDRELQEDRRYQDKLKAELKYDAKRTYKMYVAKKENARKKENEKTKSVVIETNFPIETSRGSPGAQVAKKTANNLRTTSAENSVLLTAALPKVSARSSAKHPPLHVPVQPWTSKHRRRLVVQWLKTLQNPAERTDKDPGSSKTTQQLAMEAGKATNKAPGDKLVKIEGENVDISCHQDPATQDPCNCEPTSATAQGTANDVQSKSTISKATKPQHSVWSSDSESDSSSDQEGTSNIKISKTMLEVITTTQHSTTRGKRDDEKSQGVVSKAFPDAAMVSPEVSTCLLTQTSVNTPVENPSSSSIDACDKDSDSPSTPKND